MKIDFENTRLYVRPGATDLRKGVSGLLAIIENDMHLNALDESIFLFCNKSHKLLKLIFWDKTGFWLAQKSLNEIHDHGRRIQRKHGKSHSGSWKCFFQELTSGVHMKKLNFPQFSKKKKMIQSTF